jgi:16S rRNA (guanine527-N7)-methyltransferase
MSKLLEQLQKQLPHEWVHRAAAFEKFLELLNRWNKTYNLTAIRDINQMIPMHLLDCIAIIPCIQGKRVLDVGTGPGFPGIPLAICMPDIQFTLVESNGKRIQFLQTVKHDLKLDNVEICQERIEQYQPERGFDTITSRAFSSLVQFIDLTRHVCLKDGVWCAMKGQIPYDELALISQTYEIFHYDIPGQDVARCCIIIKNKE